MDNLLEIMDGYFTIPSDFNLIFCKDHYQYGEVMNSIRIEIEEINGYKHQTKEVITIFRTERSWYLRLKKFSKVYKEKGWGYAQTYSIGKSINNYMERNDFMFEEDDFEHSAADVGVEVKGCDNNVLYDVIGSNIRPADNKHLLPILEGDNAMSKELYHRLTKDYETSEQAKRQREMEIYLASKKQTRARNSTAQLVAELSAHVRYVKATANVVNEPAKPKKVSSTPKPKLKPNPAKYGVKLRKV